MKLRTNLLLKVVAWSGAIVFLLLTATLVIGSVIAYDHMHNATKEYVEGELLSALAYEKINDVCVAWQRGDDPVALFAESNLYFRITELNGSVLENKQKNENIKVFAGQYIYSGTTAANVEIGFDMSFPESDEFRTARDFIGFVYDIRSTLPWIALCTLLLSIGCLVWVMLSAGWRRGCEMPKCGWVDYLPLELLVIGCCFLLEIHMGPYMGLVYVVFAVIDAVALVFVLRTLAVRVKTHTFLRHSVVGWSVCLIARGCRSVSRMLAALVQQIPFPFITGIAIVLNSVLDLIVYGMSYPDAEIFLVFLMIKNICVGAVLIFAVMMLRRIRQVGSRLAAGQLDAKVDVTTLVGEFKRFGIDMNRIGDGMSLALEERMRSERFRTELITNVSHDIKTPLTSIVNYVDLMKKENITEDPLRTYIEVIDRQSARLKKLTEDLIEASKASTGNVAVHLEVCDAAVLLSQAVGEYAARMQDAQLETVLNIAEQPACIMADGRLLWRVLDNLFNNIVKYAMPGTRVYVGLITTPSGVQFLFRNISRDALDVPGDALLERFTRGDSSRSTEGSGLGLSIANSLTELQGGKMSLVVDGDLFKIVLVFPFAPEP